MTDIAALHAPPHSDRAGRPFTLRLEPTEETRLQAAFKTARETMAMGYNAHRRHSFGYFLVWAALQWKSPQLHLPAKKKPDFFAKDLRRGKTRARPRKGKTKRDRARSHRKAAAKPKKKGKKR